MEEEANKENARVGKEKGKTKAVVESASPPAAKSTRSRASFGKRAGEKYRSVAKEDDEETRAGNRGGNRSGRSRSRRSSSSVEFVTRLPLRTHADE